MAELKSKATDQSVSDFIEKIENAQQKADCVTLKEIFERHTSDKGTVWSNGMLGYERKMYRYSTGRELEWFKTMFAPRKSHISVYLNVYGLDKDPYYAPLMEHLGKFKAGCGCLNIKRLDDVDLGVLEQMIAHSLQQE